MRTALILPTLGRPDQAAKCVEQLLRTSSADVVLVMPFHEALSDTWTRDYTHVADDARVNFALTNDPLNASEGWNHGLKMQPDYDAYFLAADDIWAEDGWFDEVLRVHKATGAGMVGINDMHSDGHIMATHYWMTRQFIVEHNGGVMSCPWYRSWCMDLEATERAKRANTYAWAQHAKVEHRHVHWGAAPMDGTYAFAKPRHIYDQVVCDYRRRNGWPDDFEAVIS
jgi:hypothetical protein